MVMKHGNRTNALLAAGALITMLTFQNCSEVSFDTQVDNGSTCSPDPSDICHQSTETLRAIQPAVAVRGISCLMCHAQVKANIITDFGYGSPWYFGGASVGINTPSWFTNYYNTWQAAAAVSGSIIVPNAQVPTNIQNSVSEFADLPPMSLKKLMTTPYKAPQNWGGNEPYEGTVEMTYKITPAAGQEKVVEKSQILISSPSEADIEALAVPRRCRCLNAVLAEALM